MSRNIETDNSIQELTNAIRAEVCAQEETKTRELKKIAIREKEVRLRQAHCELEAQRVQVMLKLQGQLYELLEFSKECYLKIAEGHHDPMMREFQELEHHILLILSILNIIMPSFITILEGSKVGSQEIERYARLLEDSLKTKRGMIFQMGTKNVEFGGVDGDVNAEKIATGESVTQ